MNLVIDASVFVAASQMLEVNYSFSDALMARVVGKTVHCPSLVLSECAAALMRATNDPVAARKVLRQLRDALWLKLVPLSDALADQSAEAAIRCHTRGADSCYIALAAQLGATLITWDREMLERGSELAETMTPEQWLQKSG
jgi:predicted nucleic acid-binding protein